MNCLYLTVGLRVLRRIQNVSDSFCFAVLLEASRCAARSAISYDNFWMSEVVVELVQKT